MTHAVGHAECGLDWEQLRDLMHTCVGTSSIAAVCRVNHAALVLQEKVWEASEAASAATATDARAIDESKSKCSQCTDLSPNLTLAAVDRAIDLFNTAAEELRLAVAKLRLAVTYT